MDEPDQSNLPSDEEQILINKINMERAKITELLRNPLSNFQTLDVFKKYFAEDLTLSAILSEPEVRMQYEGEEPLTLIDQLHNEIESLQIELKFAVERATAKNNENTRLRKAMNEMQVTSIEEPINESNIGQVEENARKRFQLEKKRLKKVLSAIFPADIDTRDLIAKLVAEGINNPGEYITIDEMEGTRERISMLLKTNLFELNPSGALEIRMVDID